MTKEKTLTALMIFGGLVLSNVIYAGMKGDWSPVIERSFFQGVAVAVTVYLV